MKLFGKRGKDQPGDQPPPQQHDPRSAFAVAPLPRHAGPPASSTPLADQLGRGGPGVTEGYVVLPRGLAEQMPLPWQQQAAAVLAQFHHTHRGLSWPRYRVLPSREERLVDLDEDQLAEAGFVVELDVNGDLVYRERNGRKIPDPEQTTVLVTCLDPVQPQRAVSPQPPSPQVRLGAPVPMNIGPQPVWDVVPSKAHREPAPSFPPAPREPAPREPAQREPAEPQAAQPAARTTPPATQPPTQPAASKPEATPEADEATPPRGIPVGSQEQQDPLDWFAEPPKFAELKEPEGPEGLGEEQAFGPSGEPIERPFRYGS